MCGKARVPDTEGPDGSVWGGRTCRKGWCRPKEARGPQRVTSGKGRQQDPPSGGASPVPRAHSVTPLTCSVTPAPMPGGHTATVFPHQVFRGFVPRGCHPPAHLPSPPRQATPGDTSQGQGQESQGCRDESWHPAREPALTAEGTEEDKSRHHLRPSLARDTPERADPDPFQQSQCGLGMERVGTTYEYVYMHVCIFPYIP